MPSDLRFFARRALTRAHGRAFATQLGGEAFTLTLAGAPIAAAGFWPMEGCREAWFMVTPALRRKSVLPAALRMIGDVLAAHYDPDVPIVAAVQRENRGGMAFAARLGFIDGGEHPAYPAARLMVLVG